MSHPSTSEPPKVPSDHGGKEFCQSSNLSHCPCSGHSDSTRAAQAHKSDSRDDRQSTSSGQLTVAKLAERDRQQTSVCTRDNKSAETTATLDEAARSLGVDALGLFEEEREHVRSMAPMDRFLAEKKTGTLAKPVTDGKHEVRDHDQDLISLDSTGMTLGADTHHNIG